MYLNSSQVAQWGLELPTQHVEIIEGVSIIAPISHVVGLFSVRRHREGVLADTSRTGLAVNITPSSIDPLTPLLPFTPNLNRFSAPIAFFQARVLRLQCHH
jgi:hypothetical protein